MDRVDARDGRPLRWFPCRPRMRGLVASITFFGWHSQHLSANVVFSTLPGRVQAVSVHPGSDQAPDPGEAPGAGTRRGPAPDAPGPGPSYADQSMRTDSACGPRSLWVIS